MFSDKTLTEKEQKKLAELVDDINILVDDAISKNECSKLDAKFEKKKSSDEIFREAITKNSLKIYKKKLPSRKILAVILSFILIFVVIPSSLPYLYGNDENSGVSISFSSQSVHDGDTIFINVTIPASNNVRSVTADMGGIETIDLSLADNSTNDKLWQAKWVVRDAKAGEYFATIKAIDANKTQYSSMIDWSVLPLDDIKNETGGTANSDVPIFENGSSNETIPPSNETIPPENDDNETTNETIVSNLIIWDDTDYEKRYANDMITFYADYSSFNQSIENAVCLISFNEEGWTEPVIMDYANNLYIYSKSFDKSGIYEYNVSCSAVGYENKSMISECDVSEQESTNESTGGETETNTSLPKPLQPTDFFAKTFGESRIDLSWSKGVGANNTYIVRKIGSYPTNRNDGALVYDGTEKKYSDTRLSQSINYYYVAWSYTTWGTLQQWSDDYASANAKTNTNITTKIYDDFWEQKTGQAGSFISSKMNYQKAWVYLFGHTVWNLQAHINDQWEDVGGLTINYKDVTEKSKKFTLDFTATVNPRANYSLTLTIDIPVDDYSYDDDSKTFDIKYTAFDHQFTLRYDYSDVSRLSGLSFDNNIIDGKFQFRIQRNNIPFGTHIELDPTYGLIADQTTSSFEWNPQTGKNVSAVRVNNSEYYLIGAGTTNFHGSLNTIRVWNNNGTIRSTNVSSWTFNTTTNAVGSIFVQKVYGNIYACFYCNGGPNNVGRFIYAFTFRVWDTNGTIQQSKISGDVRSEYLGKTLNGANITSVLKMGVSTTSNIFVIAYCNYAYYFRLKSYNITNAGVITALGNVTIDNTISKMPTATLEAVDSNTFVWVYSGKNTDGHMGTRDITATGTIAASNTSSWEFDRYNAYYPFIKKVGTSSFVVDTYFFAIAYVDSDSDGRCNITQISGAGAITKSWVSGGTLEFAGSDTVYYPYIFNVSYSSAADRAIYGISYRNSASDGVTVTMAINTYGLGAYSGTVIDTLTFSTDCYTRPATIYCAGNYFLTVYSGPNTDGWACTYQIYANQVPQISNPSPADGATGVTAPVQLSVTVSDIGDMLNVTWSSNSSGSWVQFGANRSSATNQVMSYGAINTSVTSSREYNKQWGEYPDVIKVGSDATFSYYAIVNCGIGSKGLINTTKVWNSNGSVNRSCVDSYTFDTKGGSYPRILYWGDNTYIIVYYNNVTSRDTVITVDISTTGIITKSIGASLTLTYFSSGSEQTRIDVVRVTGNTFVVAHTDSAGRRLYLETFTVDNKITINGPIDIQAVNGAIEGVYPRMCMVDSDTVAIVYNDRGTNYGYLTTYDIDSGGNIGGAYVDSWTFDTQVSYPFIKKLGSSNCFAIAYRDVAGDGRCNTTRISDAGAITKSWFSGGTLEFDTADCAYPFISSLENNLYVITYQGTDGDGWMKTIKIKDDGQIPDIEYDSLEFDSTDNMGFAPMVSMGSDFYYIAWVGTGHDGWSCTVKIENETGTIVRQTNTNYSNFGTIYYWRVTLSDGTNTNYTTYSFTMGYTVKLDTSPTGLSLQYPGQRKLARDSNGYLYCVYNRTYGGASNIMCAKSTDDGVNWTEYTLTASATISHRGPSIAVDSYDYLHVVFNSSKDGGGGAGNGGITYMRSTDGGASWGTTRYLTKGDSLLSQMYPCMAVDSTDKLHVVWYGRYSGTGANYEIRYCNSTNRGMTWSWPSNVTTYSLFETGTAPSMAIDSNDFVHVVWHSTMGGAGGIEIRYSTENGRGIWSAAVTISVDSNSNDQTYPCIAIDGDDYLHVVWYGKWSGGSVTQIRYTKKTTTWSAPYNISEYTGNQYNPSISVTTGLNDLKVVWYGQKYAGDSALDLRFSEYKSTRWYQPTNLTYSMAYNFYYPNLIWAENPNGTNRPYAGYAFIYANSTTIKYYESTDLSWTVLSCDVSPSTWDIGRPSEGGINETTGSYFTFTNNGNVDVSVQIKASDAVNSSTGFTWNLTQEQSENNFSLRRKTGAEPWKYINETYAVFSSNIATTGTQTFDLKMLMATASTMSDINMTVTVTFKSIIK